MIRKQEEKDINRIIDMWEQATIHAHSFLPIPFINEERHNLSKIYLPLATTWVFEDNNIVFGFIRMLGNEIGGLFVLPSYQNKCIGTQLVNSVLKLHNELEVEIFKRNKIGRAFYEKYGFKQVKEYLHTESNNHMLRMVYRKS